MTKVFKEPKSYIQRVLMRSISRMNPSNYTEEVTPTPPGPPPVKLTPFENGDIVSRFVLNPNGLTNQQISDWIASLPKETDPQQPGYERLRIALLSEDPNSYGTSLALIKVSGDNEDGYYIEVRLTDHNPNVIWFDNISCAQAGKSEAGWYTSPTGSGTLEKIEQETTYECQETDAENPEIYHPTTYTVGQNGVSEHFATLNGSVFGNVK